MRLLQTFATVLTRLRGAFVQVDVTCLASPSLWTDTDEDAAFHSRRLTGLKTRTTTYTWRRRTFIVIELAVVTKVTVLA